jgi:hypothetical protein
MTTALIPLSDIQTMAVAMAKSNLFGAKTADQALAIMLLAQAQGRHPASAAMDYDIIQGRPAKKSDAMLRDFLQSGGTVEWHALTDDGADATFSHPQGGKVRITWDAKRAAQAGLNSKGDMYKKYPRQMFRARCVSEGVRTVCPMATGGLYVPEEVREFTPTEKDITPAKGSVDLDMWDGKIEACTDKDALTTLWKAIAADCKDKGDSDAHKDLRIRVKNRADQLSASEEV